MQISTSRIMSLFCMLAFMCGCVFSGKWYKHTAVEVS